MRLRGAVAVVAIGSMVFATTAIAATAPPVAGVITCVSTAANPRVTATVPASLTSPRVFFRANNEKTEYYVDMHRSGANTNNWFAILPAIEPITHTITYRVAAVNENRQWVVSAPITVNATKSCPATLTPEEQSMTNGVVLGLTYAGQPEVPPGFSCRGIVNVIGVDCQMRPADACRRLLAQQQQAPAKKAIAAAPGHAGAAAAAAGEGLSNRTLALIAGLGAIGGFLIYNSQSNKTTASPSRP